MRSDEGSYSRRERDWAVTDTQSNSLIAQREDSTGWYSGVSLFESISDPNEAICFGPLGGRPAGCRNGHRWRTQRIHAPRHHPPLRNRRSIAILIASTKCRGYPAVMDTSGGRRSCDSRPHRVHCNSATCRPLPRLSHTISG